MKYYAVRRGHKTGIFHSWSECEQKVNGFNGAQFKSFKTIPEANNYLNNGSNASKVGPQRTNKHIKDHVKSSEPYLKPIAKNNKSEDIVETKLEYNDDSKLVIISGKSNIDNGTKEIYTDGASKNNQRTKQGGSSAGYGVYYGENDVRNLSGKVQGAQTNQRAELSAIYYALRQIKNEFDTGIINKYKILTDSMYSIHCLTKWFKNWERNGWKNSTGKDVINQDIIKSCLKLIKSVNSIYLQKNMKPLEFEHVKGHAGIYGNEMADILAVAGCGKIL